MFGIHSSNSFRGPKASNTSVMARADKENASQAPHGNALRAKQYNSGANGAASGAGAQKAFASAAAPSDARRAFGTNLSNTSAGVPKSGGGGVVATNGGAAGTSKKQAAAARKKTVSGKGGALRARDANAQLGATTTKASNKAFASNDVSLAFKKTGGAAAAAWPPREHAPSAAFAAPRDADCIDPALNSLLSACNAQSLLSNGNAAASRGLQPPHASKAASASRADSFALWHDGSSASQDILGSATDFSLNSNEDKLSFNVHETDQLQLFNTENEANNEFESFI